MQKLIRYNKIIGISLSCLLFIQATYANSAPLKPKEIFHFACNVLSEKFYFQNKGKVKHLEKKYENKIYNLSHVHKYLKKITSKLGDPYTRFLSKEEFEEEQNIINSTFVGIGIKLSNTKPIILDVLPESPAKLADLKPNDYILAVNNKNTRGLNAKEVANFLKGSPGTYLTLKVKRGSEVLSKNVEIKELKFIPISTKKLDNNLAVIKISSFIPANTSNLFKEEVSKLMGADGLVIDLRNNSGGLLKNAVEIADMFLSEGKIVTVQGSNKINEFANSATIFNGEIVVLVNEITASASEILTSALKENKRAVIIGKKTYGKGLVQEIVRLPDSSALHITTAAYLTPSGKSLDKKGIVPDIVISEETKQIGIAKEILSAKNKRPESYLAVNIE